METVEVAEHGVAKSVARVIFTKAPNGCGVSGDSVGPRNV